MMKFKYYTFLLLRFTILTLILLNLPGFTLVYISDSLSSIFSYASYGLILLFVLLSGKSGNSLPMLFIGLAYFLISSLSSQLYMPEFNFFIIIIIKYFIIIWGGYEVMKKTTAKELILFMFLGALSILGNIYLFNDPKADYGRYSGFYLDPNNAGLICLLGFALSFTINKKIRLFLKAAFTILGLLTFSRTFIVSWIFINLISIKLDIKNIRIFAVGIAILGSLLIYNEFLPVKNQRLEALSSIFTGNKKKTKSLENDSRLDTWSKYYDALSEKPIFGNGYKSFAGNGVSSPVGVHNTFLLIWGEAGIIPFLLFSYFIFALIRKSWSIIYTYPHLLMMITALSLFLLTNHNFFTNDYSLLIVIWIHAKIQIAKFKVLNEKQHDAHEQVII